ncbi:hypothetical protein H696_02859 [Fonticula alba]|uniref:Ras-GAP domain-containing protein n=1 Tax=Fonticula alba TaxID=691883 RepID=A0A058Z8E9_FONAL|nr:hypothetical protein H696_02859 [Fonticula alba]KCV70510.1 hypothetical protein H696_02859 [Fonticula alba]|eukprot:XP_009495026.1 hypothetical protein H696_02859 [Fonticula alba]
MSAAQATTELGAGPRVETSLVLEVVEAKDLRREGGASAAAGQPVPDEGAIFCGVKVNSQLVHTTASTTVRNSLWTDVLHITEQDVGRITSAELVIWEDLPYGSNRVLGKVSLPVLSTASGNIATGGHMSYPFHLANPFPLASALPALDQQKNELLDCWVPIHPASTEGTVSGFLEFEIASTNNSVFLTISRGVNLVSRDVNGLSDPYVVMTLLRGNYTTAAGDAAASAGAPVQTFRTKTIRKTLNPQFNETFRFESIEDLSTAVIHVSVWDWDRFTDDDFMGHAALPLYKYLSPGGQLSGRHKIWLEPKPAEIRDTSESKQTGDKPATFALDYERFLCQSLKKGLLADAETPQTGSVRFRYKFLEEIILGREKYDTFLELLQRDNYAIPSLLNQSLGKEREVAAWSLMKITSALSEDDAFAFLQAICQREIDATLSSSTIFRGNSLASKAVDVFQKLVALEYLHRTFGPTIMKIAAYKKSCEIDPLRLEKGQDIKKHKKRLVKFTDEILDALFQSVSEVPMSLRRVLQHIRTTCAEKFPSEASTAGLTAVAGFFFLRLVVASILSPHLFGFLSDCPSMTNKQAARAFTLIAKTVQNLANLVEFGAKEPHMQDLNQDIIIPRMSEMRTFLLTISTATSTDVAASGPPAASAPPPLLKQKSKKSVSNTSSLAFSLSAMSLVSNNDKAAKSIDIPRECSVLHQIVQKYLPDVKRLAPSMGVSESLVAEFEQNVLSLRTETDSISLAAVTTPTL